MDCSYFWRFALTLKVSAAVNELLADYKSRCVTDIETQCLCVLSQSGLQLTKSRQLIPIRQKNQTKSKVNRPRYSTKWRKIISNQHILSSKDKEEGLTSQGLRQGPWLKFDALGPLQWTQSYDPVVVAQPSQKQPISFFLTFWDKTAHRKEGALTTSNIPLIWEK